MFDILISTLISHIIEKHVNGINDFGIKDKQVATFLFKMDAAQLTNQYLVPTLSDETANILKDGDSFFVTRSYPYDIGNSQGSFPNMPGTFTNKVRVILRPVFLNPGKFFVVTAFPL